MWRNDISGSEACGGMIYPDQLHVEELHIRTRCMWRNHIFGPDVCMWRNDLCGSDGCGRMTYPDQVGVEE
jgi:hypothetical protein